MHRVLSLLIFVFLAGCASGPARPASIAAPDIAAGLTHPVFFGSSTTAPASIDVIIRNRADVPITIRRVEVDSPGMVEYTIARTIRTMEEVLQPGAVQTISLSATAFTRTTRPTEPMMIRTVVEFQSGAVRWREMRLRND